ncbi:MAG TPA: tRNA (adenosine(37)-N6)-threonylcarbamoyltransferase complex ATPase subunit type 1 TsaE [Gemmataceae bacterium]|nr:tRNA (adenosine(37)-N6)-threonylcarbamoyltransferase complex ATPase subunit type 1 TsaE [Gemmataceae bacterium]
MADRAATAHVHPVVIEVASAAETTALGKRLASVLFPGAVIALVGQLGAGKTFLVRAIAEGLGIADSRVVTSPTFVLIQEYGASLPMYHFDAYRLLTQAEFVDLGVHEYFEGRGVSFVEWADRVEGCLPLDHLRVTLEITGPETRRIELKAFGERYAAILEKFRQVAPQAKS